MALVKDQRPHDHAQDDKELAHYQQHISSWGMYEFNDGDKSSGNTNASIITRSSSLSSPSSTNSSGALGLHRAMNNYHQQEEGHSVISFKPCYDSDNYLLQAGHNGSFLSFSNEDYSSILNQDQVRGMSNVRLLENINSIQTAGSTMEGNLNYGNHESFAWLNTEGTMPSDGIDQDLTAEELCLNKRPHMVIHIHSHILHILSFMILPNSLTYMVLRSYNIKFTGREHAKFEEAVHHCNQERQTKVSNNSVGFKRSTKYCCQGINKYINYLLN